MEPEKPIKSRENKIFIMKKIKHLFFIALFFSAFSNYAQLTMSFGSTNAATVSPSGLIYTVTIPFYATQLTGNFRITKTTFSCTTPGAIKTMSVNNFNTGAFIANNGSTNTNYVNLSNTYTFPIGTTILKVRSECYSPGSPSNPIYNNITVIVNKLPDPILNITLTPYCQIDNHTGNYTNYFGYKVAGTAVNRTGLRFRVTPDNLAACPSQTYCNLNGSFTFTGNDFNAGSSFYSCNTATYYNVYLEYVYTPFGASTPVVYSFANNTYGWQNHRWRKTFATCIPVMDPDKDDVLLNGKLAESQTKIFPNPTDGIFTIEGTNNDETIQSIKVFDLNNIQLLALNKPKSNKVDLSKFKKGTYIVHIETVTGLVKKRILKK